MNKEQSATEILKSMYYSHESPSEVSIFERDVFDVLSKIAEMLFEKNEKYGNSALEPLRIFSKASSTEQLRVRIDDKLSRIQNTGLNSGDEDTLNDLIGYLILLKISIKCKCPSCTGM